jgi:hypothetical protein
LIEASMGPQAVFEAAWAAIAPLLPREAL